MSQEHKGDHAISEKGIPNIGVDDKECLLTSREENHAIPQKEVMVIHSKSETDCISELPKDILCSIVSNLSVWDVVRTSLMSNRWTDICDSISKLDFDFHFMFRKDVVCASKSRDNHEIKIYSDYQDTFVRGVNRFLQIYKGLRLEFFGVTFCFKEKYTHDLDKWVIFALSKGVKDLSLILSHTKNLPREYFDGLYLLRSEVVFQCYRSKELESLSLYCCNLEPGVGTYCHSLRTLKISTTGIGNRHLEALLSSLLNLETLILDAFINLCFLRIPRSLNRLKFLKITRCCNMNMVEIWAANLVSLDHSCRPQRVSYFGACSLKHVSQSVPDIDSVSYTFCQLALVIPQLETLSVSFNICKIYNLPEKITTFSRLKKLHIAFDSGKDFDALRIIGILKACPLLEIFFVEAFSVVDSGDELAVLPAEYGVHNHLKEVRIMGFKSGKFHIKIASCLLDYCVVLEAMVFEPVMRSFNPWYGAPYVRFQWGDSERAMVFSQLKDHPKSYLITFV